MGIYILCFQTCISYVDLKNHALASLTMVYSDGSEITERCLTFFMSWQRDLISLFAFHWQSEVEQWSQETHRNQFCPTLAPVNNHSTVSFLHQTVESFHCSVSIPLNLTAHCYSTWQYSTPLYMIAFYGDIVLRSIPCHCIPLYVVAFYDDILLYFMCWYSIWQWIHYA